MYMCIYVCVYIYIYLLLNYDLFCLVCLCTVQWQCTLFVCWRLCKVLVVQYVISALLFMYSVIGAVCCLFIISVYVQC